MRRQYLRRKRPLAVKIIFSLMPLFILFIISEIVLNIAFFVNNTERHHFLATIDSYYFLKKSYVKQKSVQLIKDTTGYQVPFEKIIQLEPLLRNELFKESNKNLLDLFFNQYEFHFHKLISEAKRYNIKVLVLYLPTTWQSHYNRSPIPGSIKTFYNNLANKYQVDFLDVTDALLAHPEREMTFVPVDGHLSQKAHQIVAEELRRYIDKHSKHRSAAVFNNRPELFGDCPPGTDELITWKEELPYKQNCNGQGLRNKDDLDFPKTRQRILILGDSYAFGPYLDNHETMAGILGTMYPEKEVLNAAWPGYTILDEASLFLERAKYTEPDIVILQVLDNDIHGLSCVFLNFFSRVRKQGHIFQPDPLEKPVLDNILSSISK